MTDSAPEVTDPSAFRKRSLGKMVLFFVVTFGVYGIYWMHQVNKQTAAGTDRSFSPGLRTIGLIIPIVNFYFVWKFAQDSEAYVDQEGVVLFLLWIVFAPAAWYLTAAGINRVTS